MPDPTVNPQHATEVVQLSINSTQAQANEAVAQVEARTNGASGHQAPTANAPQMVDAASVLKMAGEGKARIISIHNRVGEHEAFATLFEEAGLHAQAAAIRGQALDPSIGGMVKRGYSRKVRVGDVLVFAVGATVLFLIYEGIAYKFDWPRYGVWGEANPLKAVKK